ncbi:MAG: PAS domain-containing protein [Eubacteriales bacterium]|nr:PAS domain-containing protein [Eubacteriales bacterium]MDD4683235.1 PAS domain-containing protein [Eubacteriales bacterium]
MMSVDNTRVKRLGDYISQLQSGENIGAAARELYMQYQQDLLAVTPQEAFEIFTDRFKGGERAADILVYLDKIINVFHRGLTSYKWNKPVRGSFVGLLRRENEELVRRLDLISDKLQTDSIENQRSGLLADTSELLEFEAHYLKKENILFPYMEKQSQRYEGVAIMWSLHDEARNSINAAIAALSDGPAAVHDESELSVIIGKLFFAMHGLVQKEELILFPAASEIFTEVDFLEMLRQSYEYGFPFVGVEEIPDKLEVIAKLQSAAKDHEAPSVREALADCLIRSETGTLTAEQALMIFSALPVDLSYVDEYNKLRYFSRPKDRIFPRSPAAIGRDVKNCHPPESVHIVEEIIDAFRSGKQDAVSFWIEVRGRFVLIQYFALRDAENSYRGVLEVSQDISDIRKLEGQRRLLQWDQEDI